MTILFPNSALAQRHLVKLVANSRLDTSGGAAPDLKGGIANAGRRREHRNPMMAEPCSD